MSCVADCKRQEAWVTTPCCIIISQPDLTVTPGGGIAELLWPGGFRGNDLPPGRKLKPDWTGLEQRGEPTQPLEAPFWSSHLFKSYFNCRQLNSAVPTRVCSITFFKTVISLLQLHWVSFEKHNISNCWIRGKRTTHLLVYPLAPSTPRPRGFSRKLPSSALLPPPVPTDPAENRFH